MWKWVNRKKVKGVFVIIHGAGEYHVRYKWTIEQLNEAGFHVIMGDLPGQGTTEGPRGHIRRFDQYIEKVEEWMAKAREYNVPVILFGHSMGGLIATRALMRMQEEQLPDIVVFSSPCFGLYNKTPLRKKAVAGLLNNVVPGLRFPSGLEKGSGTRTEEMRLRDETDSLLIKRVSIRWYRELEKSINFVHQKLELFPEVPLLIMQGGDDRIVDKYRVKEWFNNVDVNDKYYKEWDGLYHEVLNEPERYRVLAHMLGFITVHLYEHK